MCFMSKTPPRVRRAEKNITVWKVVKAGHKMADAFSLVRTHAYHLNQLQPRLALEVTRFLYPEPNLSSYLINQGYHSYATREKAETTMDPCNLLAHFIIPRGAWYIQNDKSEIVSNTIILKKVYAPRTKKKGR